MNLIQNQILLISLFLTSIVLMSCGESESGDSSSASTKAMTVASSPEADAWGSSLRDWPTMGDPGRVGKTSVDKSSYDLWNDIRVDPSTNPPPETVVYIIEKTSPLIEPLRSLNGAWAQPNPGSGRISGRSIRGLAKSIWSDLRLAIVKKDQAQAFGDLVVLANLPRVARAFDPSDRGLMPSLAVAGMFNWGMMDLARASAEFKLTPAQCQILQNAASWIHEPLPFGAVSEQNTPTFDAFKSRELTELKSSLAKLCGG